MLLPPPRGIASVPIRTVPLEPSRLFRISSHSSGEPHFGYAASNRFDDPTRIRKRRFGTCYLGESLEVAIAETILHDEMPSRGRFLLAASEIERRFCVRFRGGVTLTLVDLTGAAAKSLVGSGEISTITPYDIPQRWARALHGHPCSADGVVYMSRHVNDKRAVVLFDRASTKLGAPSYLPLPEMKGALAAVMNLRVSFRFL